MLDEKVDQKVCEYLRRHHAEYRNVKQKIVELKNEEHQMGLKNNVLIFI